MKSHYTCSKCKKLLASTEDNFFPSLLKNADKNINQSVISQCKVCSKQYSEEWRKAIKAKGLTRNQRTTFKMAGAVNGVVYVIGPDITGTPYKIGITSGSNTDKRKRALQTSHWLELKEVWKSKVLLRADLIERKIHKHFEKKRVRGEWFNISRKDIKTISALVEKFEVQE